MKNFSKKLFVKLSDKILVIIFLFATALVALTKYIVDASILQILILSYIVYNSAFVLTFLISRHFSNRLVNLTFKIEEMAAGNLSKELHAKGKDEIAQLTHAIRELKSRLQSGITQDVFKHRELRQAKTDFVSLASHQLRTPLSIIKWYVDYLICGDAGEMGEEQLKYLKEIYHSNERLIELVNALLDVSRIDVGTFSIDPEPTDIIERLELALRKFIPEITNKKIKLDKQYDDLPTINLDPRLTKIVFENILSNAVKYTPKGGNIRIVIKKTGENVLIKISDSGCGIPREQQPQIFTKMFRADNVKRIEASGTGLGLYIAKAVIEKSGGKIWFESPSLDLLLETSQKISDLPLDKRNQGTTFNITIPLKGMRPKQGTKKLTSLE